MSELKKKKEIEKKKKNSAYMKGLGGFHEKAHSKHLAERLAFNKCSINISYYYHQRHHFYYSKE